MTRQELSRHVELKKQLAADLKLLATLETAAGSWTQAPTGDAVGALSAEIADVKMEIGELEVEIVRSEAAIMRFIATVEDARTRLVLRLRFIHGLTWKEAATVIGGVSEGGIKILCCRYMTRRDARD